MSTRRGSIYRFLSSVIILSLMINPSLLHYPASRSTASAQVKEELLDTIVKVVAPTEPVEYGEAFTVQIEIDGLESRLTAFQIDLQYDSWLIRPISIIPGSFLSESGRDVVCPEPAFFSSGILRFACGSSGIEP